MRNVSRFLGVFLFLLVLFSAYPVASASGTEIFQTEDLAKGCFSVEYATEGNQKMKVGVTHSTGTVYYDYTPGTRATYVFTRGDGDYVVSLYQNITGTSYHQIASTGVTVKLEDALSVYRVSTTEITFSKDDAVGTKAAELCLDKADEAAKIVAIHNYIAANFSYDNDFAAGVNSGRIKNYTPDTGAVLEAKKGICYDFSALFAAMCRSQDIACKIEKGYVNGTYHAWNSVFTEGRWNSLDLTSSIARGNTAAKTLADCIVAVNAA